MMTKELTPEAATKLAADIEQTWLEATLAADIDGLAALFSDDVVFLGSHPRIYIGREELMDYLAGAPMGGRLTIVFSNRQVRPLGPDVFTTTSYVKFGIGGGDAHYARWAISWTISRRKDRWEIVQHHASPRQGPNGKE